MIKWTISNAFGGVFWIAGLCYAKGLGPAFVSLPANTDHRLLTGAVVGLAGLSLLLWSNLRGTA